MPTEPYTTLAHHPLDDSLARSPASVLNVNPGTGVQRNYHQIGDRNQQVNVENFHYAEALDRPETPPLPASISLPFGPDPNFVNRPELETLKDKVVSPAARVAVVGLGGVGKSQLVIQHCYCTQKQSPKTWILWIHASTSSRFDASIRKLADDVKIRGRNDAKASIYQLVYDWLRDGKNGKWLLIVDSADEADFLFQPPDMAGREETSDRQRRIDYLPNCAHGSMIVTTRNQDVAIRMVDDSNAIILEPMNEAQALALLAKKLELQYSSTAAAKLTAALEYMPLAITQAAGYINNNAKRCSVEQYLARFEKSEKSRTSLLEADSRELRRDRDAKNSIIVTWQISFEHIYESKRSAADLLSLMSFFDHQGIPDTVLRCNDTSRLAHGPNAVDSLESEADLDTDTASDHSACEAFSDDLTTLCNYFFISIGPTDSMFTMHRLVQLATRRWLQKRGQYQQWAAQSVRNLDCSFPNGDYENWAECRVLYPHVQSALDIKVDERNACLIWASVLYKGGWFAWRQGSLIEAELFVSKSLKTRKNILGDDHETALDNIALLALVLQDQGKYEAAEEMGRQALEGSEKALGKDHPSTLKSVSNLAAILCHQGKYEAAEKMNQRTLKGWEKALGKDHPRTLTSVCNLSVVLQNQGKYEAAEKMSRRVLKGWEKALGKDHPDTLTSVSNLASVLQNQGKHEAAEKMSRRALEGREKVLGKDHPYTLTSVSKLSGVLQDQGKYEAAEKMSRRALEGSKKVLGNDHPDTLTSVSNLASVLCYQRKYEASEKMNRRALEGWEKALGEDHPYTITSVSNLFLVLYVQGKYEAAEKMGRRAVEGSKKAFGNDHPDTLTSVSNLALVLRAQGKSNGKDRPLTR